MSSQHAQFEFVKIGQSLNNNDIEEQPKKIVKPESSKYMYLEGLRGLGSFMVYLDHFNVNFHPYVVWGRAYPD